MVEGGGMEGRGGGEEVEDTERGKKRGMEEGETEGKSEDGGGGSG